MNINEKTTHAAWIAGLHAIAKEGMLMTDREKRECKEVMNFMITIAAGKDDILSPIDSLCKSDQWIYPSLEELEDIILTRKKIPTIQYTYGSRIFAFQQRSNQVHDFIIPLLKADPATRRAIISLYDPQTDSKIQLKEVPSLISVFFKIKDGSLHVTALYRSTDFFIGWPTNIYQLFKLQELVAAEVGVTLGSMTTISHSAHVFSEHKEFVDRLLKEGKL
jgi:thymidylate synthase